MSDGDYRPLFTVGHSNHPLAHFLSLLERHGVEVVADVRSVPWSRHAPQYRKDVLARALAERGIGHLHLGQELGGKPRPGESEVSRLDYAARVQQPAFQRGIARLLECLRERRVALLCRERDPLDCHRLHLICRHLRPVLADIRHILPDGRIEAQVCTERRLLDRAEARALPLFDRLAANAALERAYDLWWRRER